MTDHSVSASGETEPGDRAVMTRRSDALWSELSPPYSTIVADPPWQSNNDGSAFGAKGMRRVQRVPIEIQPESRYSTMPTSAICELPVVDLAARNAHLYLWATCSGLADGLAVMAAWGFTYKTSLTWIKRAPGLPGRWGMGAYFRTQTEHVLFGVRGGLGTLVNDQRNFFEAANEGHSVKPPAFADLVERCSPGPYVDLFSRNPRLGWDSWGKGYEIGATPHFLGSGAGGTHRSPDNTATSRHNGRHNAEGSTP